MAKPKPKTKTKSTPAPIDAKDIDLMGDRLGLTQSSSLYLLGISNQTRSAFLKLPPEKIRPGYALLIRLLITYPELCPIKRPVGMRELHEHLVSNSKTFSNDHAAIMLGMQKTWFYQAIDQPLLGPMASNLANLYIDEIKRHPDTAIETIRQLVETEAKSRGMLSGQIWTAKRWPRNLPGKEPSFEVVKTSVPPITGNDIEYYRNAAGLRTSQELAFVYGVSQNRLLVLLNSKKPLELAPTASLLTRMLLKNPSAPVAIPRPAPSEIFAFFAQHGIDNPEDAATMIGLSRIAARQMQTQGRTTPHTSRLVYLLQKGCEKDPAFMEKYFELVDQEAICRGLKPGTIFGGDWPVIK